MGKTYTIQEKRIGKNKVHVLRERDRERRNKRIRVQFYIQGENEQ